MDQHRLAPVYDWQSLGNPTPYGVLMHAEGARHLLDRVRPMALREPGIEPAVRHLLQALIAGGVAPPPVQPLLEVVQVIYDDPPPAFR